MEVLIAVIVIAVVVLLLVFWIIGMYNGLARARLRVKEAWSGIDVQLKRRSSLIPNLVETVKGYASHEKEVFEAVTRARAQLDNARTSGNAAQAAQADNVLTGTLRSLFAVAEAYPDLRCDGIRWPSCGRCWPSRGGAPRPSCTTCPTVGWREPAAS